MLGKDFGFKPQESYYFLLTPHKLILKTEEPQKTSTFRFAIHKGIQKLETSKNSIKAVFQNGNLNITDVQLKFNLPNFSPYKKVQFTLKVFIHDGTEQSEVGSLSLDSAKYVNSFKNDKINSYTENNVSLGQYLDLDYSLLIEKSLYQLQSAKKQPRGQSTGRAGSQVGSLKGSAKKQQIQRSPPRRYSRPVVSSSSVEQPTQEPTSTPNPPPIQKIQIQVSTPAPVQKSQKSSKKISGVQSGQYKLQSDSKKQDVRQRVSKLQKESEEDYSLHAPKISQPKKTPVRKTALRQSRLKRQVQAEEQKKQAELLAAKNQINWKNIIFKIIFIMFASFLIYHTMTPSKKFHSKKRH